MAEPERLTQGALEAKKRRVLEYPLNNPDDYKGRLVFTVLEDPATDLSNLAGAVQKESDKITNPEEDTSARETPQVDEGFSFSSLNPFGSNEQEPPKTPAEEKEEINAFQGQVNIPITNAQPLIETDKVCEMYIPIGLQYRDGVNYENMDIGGAGAGMEAGIKGGSGAIKGLIEGGLGTFAKGLAGSGAGDIATLGVVKLASNLPDEIAGAVKVAAGVTSNPNTRVLFKSVNMREFSFTFKFICTSAREAEEVKDIITFFRSELYPEDITTGLGGSQVSIGYRFPNKFRIEVEYDGKEIAHRIKPCYLRNVDVNYNNTSQSFHSDGNFSEIEMTIGFQETRTLSKKDIEEGF